MSLLIYYHRFSIFAPETLKLEWRCSQYLELNPTFCQDGGCFIYILIKFKMFMYYPWEFPWFLLLWRQDLWLKKHWFIDHCNALQLITFQFYQTVKNTTSVQWGLSQRTYGAVTSEMCTPTLIRTDYETTCTLLCCGNSVVKDYSDHFGEIINPMGLVWGN